MIRPLANLYEQLRRLPGVGSKTAMRLAYHIIDMPESEVQQLAEALSSAKKSIHYCSQCYNLTDGEKCAICSDPSRDHFTICVVEQPQDIAAMERSHGYNGLYHMPMRLLCPRLWKTGAQCKQGKEGTCIHVYFRRFGSQCRPWALGLLGAYAGGRSFIIINRQAPVHAL